ncbi:rhodanese-like domain-containing protein [Vampirovibrio sp.]|uniref:rhodanese-like domain-containing protein n=1 Tax=Vampirovibrio sp. TaxID=2717857 RepID=UPI0035936D86
MAIESPVKPNNPSQAKTFFEHKMQFTTGPVELERMMSQKQSIVVVDVREAEDYQKGHVPGAINLPKSKWSNPTGLDKNKQNILYCYSHVCHLAADAAVHLAQAGYPVMELEGGWAAWQEHDLPTTR